MKVILVALVMMLGTIASTEAKEISDVQVPDTFSAQNTALVLNGAGVRTKWFMDIYVGALYLKQKSSDASSIIAANEPMSIRLHMISGLLTSEKMKEATKEGFDNSLGGKTAPLQKEIDQFISVFEEKINEKDEYDLVYVPEKGVETFKNGKLVNAIGGGLAFKKALFGIWLSEEPAQEALKESMLGQD